MTNDFKMADTSRAKHIWTKDELLAPLKEGMEQPPHPRRLGDDEDDYFNGLPPSGQDDVRTGPANSGATAYRDDDKDTQRKDEEAAR